MKESRSLRFKLLLIFLTWLLQIGIWAVGIAYCEGSNPVFLTINGIVAILVACIVFIPKLSRLQPIVFSIAVALALLVAADLVLRVALPRFLYYRPHEMFVRRDSSRPYLLRYLPNVRYSGAAYGDLAAMSGDREFREERDITFITDAHGFRNGPLQVDGPYDLLILGDSFGAGTGTSQEETWAAILNDQAGIRTYNLSMPGGPWIHFMNLKLEFDRLDVRPEATVLLALFSGNDLDDGVGLSNDPADLEYNEGFRKAWLDLDTFRRRSSLVKLWKNVFSTNEAARSAVQIHPFPGDRRMAFYTPYVQRSRRTVADILVHPNYTHFLTVLNDLLVFCREKSLTLKIMLIPTKAEVYDWVVKGAPPWSIPQTPSALSEVLQTFCKENNLDYQDCKPALIEAAKKAPTPIWWYDDTHLNPAGHKLCSLCGSDQPK